MKKCKSILLGIYVINFLILLIIFIMNCLEKEVEPKVYLGVYFWIINLIEIIVFLANFKKINKKNNLIIIALIFFIQTSILFFIPAYSQHDPKIIKDKDGIIMPVATVMPSYYNAYGIHIK